MHPSAQDRRQSSFRYRPLIRSGLLWYFAGMKGDADPRCMREGTMQWTVHSLGAASPSDLRTGGNMPRGFIPQRERG